MIKSDPIKDLMEILDLISDPVKMKAEIQQILDLQAQLARSIAEKEALCRQNDQQLALIAQAKADLQNQHNTSLAILDAQKKDFMNQLKVFCK